MSHRKSDLGILSTPVMPKKSAKVVLGADCIEKPLEDKHKLELRRLLDAAGINAAVGCQ
jgi:hypothetical protein